MRMRTAYSFRTAVGKLPDAIDCIKGSGHGWAAITDRASTFGWQSWDQLCKKNGIRPIFGVELAVSVEPTAKKPIMDYWTFIARDDIAPINKLIELATSQFRYEPILHYHQAIGADAIKIAGERTDLNVIAECDFDKNDLWLSLSPGLSWAQASKILNSGLEDRFVLQSNNFFIHPEQKDFYSIVLGRGASVQTWPQWVMSDDELVNWFSAHYRLNSLPTKAALINRENIAQRCTATLRQGKLIVPERPKTLKQMCIEGAELNGIDLSDSAYRNRLDKELGLIEQKDFEDYFYIIADVVSWARQRMIVGPARGSSCGSLVCYLLNITTVDPLKHGLIFERFIDINRGDLPDIDIDFSDTKRQLVFDYMEQKYGRDHVARLGTVTYYKARSAIGEAGAALNIPRWKCDKAMDALIHRSSGDSRAMDTLEDTLRSTPNGQALLGEHPEVLIACEMEGHPRHYSQHAAGIIVTDRPVHDYVAVDARTGATMCNKKDAEGLNLLKIDALGLTQLSVIEDALELAGLKNEDLLKLPMDDQAAFDVLNRGHFSGIFQFNGIALQSLAKQTKIVELDDIIAITALARPGPLTSGGATEWVCRKNGLHQVVYPHPLFEPYLADTRGIVLYQEQVMEIGRNIGDLSWEDVTALRKAMSKSLGKEYFDQFGDKFKSAAEKKGIDKAVLDKVWDDLCAYGAWAFNKSHSVAYGIISYYCCWLKAHHPVEFAAATLNHEDDAMKQLAILRELHAEGISYCPVDPEHSTDKWVIGQDGEDKMLIGPVQNVKGIGPKLVQQIVSARARNEPLPERAQKLLSNPVTKLDTLWPISDRIKELWPDLREANIISQPTSIGSISEEHEFEQEWLIIGTPTTINPRDENETIMVARRGYEIKSGPLTSLNLQMQDDTGVIYCKINRYGYEKMGRAIVERGRPGKALYAVKGRAMARRRFIMVDQVRYLGDMEDSNHA